MNYEELNIRVTSSDVAAARRAWLTARDGECSEERTEQLLVGFEQLISAHAQQVADDFRSAQAAT